MSTIFMYEGESNINGKFVQVGSMTLWVGMSTLDPYTGSFHTVSFLNIMMFDQEIHSFVVKPTEILRWFEVT